MAVQTKIQHRRDTAANWTTANSVLAAGEMGFETDTLKFKIGNGSNTWANLAYSGSAFNGGTITNALTISNSLTLTTGGSVSANTFTSTTTSSAPFFISSGIRVANLNAATSGTTSNVLGGATGGIVYQTAANTTGFLAATATNNQYLTYNTATSAPAWQTPTLSNTYYAATTSAQLAGVISDETGTGVLVFGTAPTITPANAVATTAASTAGYIGLPQISVSANTAILATHAGKHIYTTTTALTHTIPANSNVAFEIGSTITFITPAAVSLSIAITTDTMYLAGTGTTGTRTLAAYGMATAVKTTATTWIISGNGLT